MRLTFRKGERLRHRSLVDKLFREGKSFYDFPLRMIWRMIDREALEREFRREVPPAIERVQMLVTVPKKKRKRAVDRVLMRRRIKEAYRLNRMALKDKMEDLADLGTLSVAFIYMHNENLPYATIEKKMRHLLYKLQQNVVGMRETVKQDKDNVENVEAMPENIAVSEMKAETEG